MPATRSRSSTEAAEVATEEVKQVVEDTNEVVEAPVVSEEVAPSEAEAVPAEAEVPVSSESVPIVEEPVAPVVETNGTSEAVPETNGNGVAEVPVESVVETDAVVEKRKSEVGGEGDGPDSTDAAPVKKAKVDDEVSAEEAVPVVEASV